MKTKHLLTRSPGRFASLAILSAAITLAASAADRGSQNSSGSSSSSAQSNRAQSTNRENSDHTSGPTVKVTRASTFLGTDVTANDGRKVGDIVDYFLDPSNTPHLKYVVVMTGGFLDYGGDARAVPARAITMEGDSARLNISSDEYWNVAVLPQNRSRFLNDRRNTERIAQGFNLSDKQSQSSQGQSNPSGSNGAGGSRLVAFSELTNEDVYDRDGQRIGRFEDAWLSLDANRAPFAEISSPPSTRFEVLPRTRYAIPLSELQSGASQTNGVRFDIAAADLRKANPVSETDGVKILQSGDIGNEILRVRVAQQ